MPANNSWQTQGRQQHGWFGNGASPHDVQRVAAPDHESPLEPVYPVEYLLGLLSGAIARTVLSAAMRNLGWREPTATGTRPRPNLRVLNGKQQKHLPGFNNYKDGNSILTADAQALVNRFAGKGVQRGPIPVGEPGSVEAFDTGNEIIGIWKDEAGHIAETTTGTIRYAKDGVHVGPAQPR